ncbi:hypothetical protein DE146DRAFT_677695 [Phaeosphaeria sp. MPI-PUGE-AT-0046c]|nr:hypothetical protein DE146DRAFT_677695 [Phaeosphaeria sp. MPI-PUGE-AT-0046c]
MATPFRTRASHAETPVYDLIAHPQATYPAFPIALHHDDSGYDASGYELRGGHPRASQQHEDDHNSIALDSCFDMLPPAQSTHATWQALHDYAQEHASEHGYALSINTTAKNRSRIKLACVCYGQPKNTHKLTAETRIRKNRVSYKTGCKMWIEGKKQEDGTWLLRVGEPQHNHAGRPSEGWAVQRKRTWGVVGGRIGVGGVTAKEELARLGTEQGDKDGQDDDGDDENAVSQNTSPSLERGGLVWKIVEQEMLHKGEPGQGRDRGVGRTVEVLQARLPNIHIFKRDVYNIRAQIKRARKAAGQQVGDGVNSEDEEAQAEAEVEAEIELQHDITQDTENDNERISTKVSASSYAGEREQHATHTIQTRDFALDPSLNRNHDSIIIPMPAHELLSASSVELEQLRKENTQLKNMLGEKTKEVKERNIEIAGLRTQLEYMTRMAMLPS